MPSYRLTYRNEFEAVIHAENAQQALKKFKANQVGAIKIIGLLHEDFFEIENQDSGIVLKKQVTL